ncbi:MAG: hypothetical protein ACYDBJ_16485 [Aggregatilineales bacterium]
MDILRLLQTIGICVGALALVVIAFMLFMAVSTFLPSRSEPEEDEENDVFIYLREKSPEEIQEILNTPTANARPSRKSRRKKGPPNNVRK